MNIDTILFIAVAAGIAGQGLDVITTNAGLATGGKELNPVVRWSISKIGLPATAFVKVGGLAIGLPVLFYSFGHPVAAIIPAVAAAVMGFYAGFVNYIAEKKAKISVF